MSCHHQSVIPIAMTTLQEDVLLCRILGKMQPSWIVGYHQHDSLLEHIDEEELSEEERKAAWANYNKQMTVETAK